MRWVGGVVSSVSCRASLHLSGMKDDFVWAGSAGKAYFVRYCTLFLQNFGYYSKCCSAISQ